MNRPSYDTDLTDAQWVLAALYVLPTKTEGRTGRPLQHERREILNALFYQLRTGCAWRLLPHDFPSWTSVYGYFRLWKRDGTLQALNDALRKQVRQKAGKAPTPSAAVMDSQSVKTTQKGGRPAPLVTMQAKRSKAASATLR